MSPVSVRDARRRFGSTTALDGVDLTLRSGEIHALLGANGAGKTTLVRILAGLERPDDGTVAIDGEPVTDFEPRLARDRGVALVQQHFTLVPTLTASQNLVLARPEGPVLPPARAAGRRLAGLVERYGLAVRDDVPAGELSVGEQQRLELLRALDADATVLLLDEPTAVLTGAEAEALLDTCRHLADEGRAVAIITHRLGEVFAGCERVTVLREGRQVIDDEPVTDHSLAGLAAAMLGTGDRQRRTSSGAADPHRVDGPAEPAGAVVAPAAGRVDGAPGTIDAGSEVDAVTAVNAAAVAAAPHRAVATGASTGGGSAAGAAADRDAAGGSAVNRSGGPSTPPAGGLRLEGLTVGALRAVTLAVAPGEIVGVAGVDGNGQAELEAAVAARLEPEAGTVTVGDRAIPAGEPRARRRLGLAYIPSDRYRWGLVRAMDLADNLELGRVPRWRRLRARRRSDATGALREWEVLSAGPAQAAGRLSGGNAQKLVLARELAGRPAAVLACYPTRGLDPGATAAVSDRLRSCAGDGAAVLWIGAELEEVLAVADRIVVLAGGRIEGPFAPPFDLAAISLAMTAGSHGRLTSGGSGSGNGNSNSNSNDDPGATGPAGIQPDDGMTPGAGPDDDPGDNGPAGADPSGVDP